MTVADAAEKVGGGDTSRSRVASIDRDRNPAERLHPKAVSVPVLQLPDGSVIEESWDILRWARAAPDAQGWWARAQSPANLDLAQRNDGDFKRHLDRWTPSAMRVGPSSQTHTATGLWMCCCNH